MSATDPIIVALTGELPFILIVSGCLGLLVSFLLLRLYRRAVQRGMARRTGAPATGEPADATRVKPAPPPAPLAITYADTGRTTSAMDGGDLNLYRRALTGPWRAAGVYGTAGALFAAVLAFAFLLAGGVELRPLRFLVLFWVYAWPLVLTLWLVAATTRQQKLLLAAGYLTGYVVLTLAAIISSPDSSASQLVVLWIITNLAPTLLLLVFLLRRVRAVGPLVVTLLVVAVTGASVLLDVLAWNQNVLRTVSGFFFSLGIGGHGAFVALIVLGLVFFAAIGWFVLQWLRRGYQAKWVNDQSLILDALWLLFGISYAIELAFEGAAWAAAGLVAFAVYLVTVRLGFRLLATDRASQGSSLLVLRVFSLGTRSETLFDAVSRHWRYVGTVQLIAGPDLATATVEPHEFLDFVSGRLERQFIDNPEALNRRLGELDTRPDFDGRFRINDFFCHDDTWQATLAALVQHSDAVLMDLREFTPKRQGCIYEIRQLLQHMPLARIVMLADATTDGEFLEQTVAAAWNALPVGAPNLAVPEPHLTVIKGSRGTDSNLHTLLAAICRAVTTQRTE
jgi:hypothetical protein